jgi:hypothetical protein
MEKKKRILSLRFFSFWGKHTEFLRKETEDSLKLSVRLFTVGSSNTKTIYLVSHAGPFRSSWPGKPFKKFLCHFVTKWV